MIDAQVDGRPMPSSSRRLMSDASVYRAGLRSESPRSDPAALASGTSFVDACAAGTLPNVSFVDPPFDSGGTGTSGDDHPLSDIRLGERFIADAYHALADNGYLDDTVLVITFDEWGGFYDHVVPPVVDDAPVPRFTFCEK